MGQFLSEAPLGVLLGLMVFPLIGAIILGAYIVLLLNRRRRKQIKQEQPDRQLETGITTEPDVIQSPTQPIAAPPPDGIPTQESLPPLASSPSPPHKLSSNKPISPSLESRLNLAVLSKELDEEKPMPDVPNSPDSETINIDTKSDFQPTNLPPSSAMEPVELLRLLRNPQSGQLIVEVAGKRYSKLVDITDKKIGQYILELTAHLLAFTNGMIVTNSGMTSVSAPSVGQLPEPILPPQPAATAATPSAPKASPEVEAAFLASLRAESLSRSESVPQKRGFLGLGKASEPAPPPVPGLNLAEEINDIVQTRLRYSPMAHTTKIEITADPQGGIRIRVNNQFYSSPAEVADQSAGELIKASIKEWEKG